MQKKFIYLLVISSIIMGFVACGKTSNKEDSSDSETANIETIDSHSTTETEELNNENNNEAVEETEVEESKDSNIDDNNTASKEPEQAAEGMTTENQSVAEENGDEVQQEATYGWAGPGFQSGYLDLSQSTSVMIHDDTLGGDVVFTVPQQVISEFSGHRLTWLYYGEGTGMVSWGHDDWGPDENPVNYYSGPSGNLIKKSIFSKDASGMGGKSTEIYY